MNRFKKFLAGALAACMALALPLNALAAQPLTRGEARELLVAAADDYNPGVTPEDVLQGYSGGDLGLDRPVTRAEALVMLSRAFGSLPAPLGDSARWGTPSGFPDVPGWAGEILENVFQAGIVTGEEGQLNPSQTVTAGELDQLIRRVYALEGSNLKDDFYAAVNKEWLETAQFVPGYPYSGTLFELNDQVSRQVSGLIGEITSQTPQPGTPQEKIKNLYENILDWDARNAAGVEPLRPYLEGIDAISSMEELVEFHNRSSQELAASLLVGFGVTTDNRDSNRNILVFAGPYPSISKEDFAGNTQTAQAFLQYLTTLLTLGGESREDAAAHAQAYYDWERALAGAMMDRQDQADLSKTFNLYTMDQLKALMPQMDLDSVLAASGFPQTEELVVSDPGLLEATASCLTGEHLELLKTAMKISLLASFGVCLNREFQEAIYDFQAAQYGADIRLPDEETAAQLVQTYLADYLSETYVERYFSPQAKADVEEMVEEIKAIYKERIQDLDWMGEATKAKAVEKLDAMAVNVGYPDRWDTYLDNAPILSAAQGGSYLSNILDISKAARQEASESFLQPADKTEWMMSTYTVNAYYSFAANSINFPAGILQAPLYDLEASSAENLGGIGYIIAHEITHAFDNNGARYDSQGNAANWWTEEDYAAFEALCGKVEAFYDGLEEIPGVPCNGRLTLSENIADLGAAACITQAEGMREEPDYAALYRSAARSWTFTATPEARAYMAQTDVHAPGKLRGSRALQSCDPFYSAFGIQPGDGMWLAPEDRVRIW